MIITRHLVVTFLYMIIAMIVMPDSGVMRDSIIISLLILVGYRIKDSELKRKSK